MDPVDELPLKRWFWFVIPVAIVAGLFAGYVVGTERGELVGPTSLGWFIGVYTGLAIGLLFLGQVIAMIRLQRALDREDFEAAMRAVRMGAGFLGSKPASRVVARSNLLAAAACGEQWDLARRCIDRVDWNQVSGRYAPFLLNNAAWCLALMGEGARAIPLAERAVGEKTYRTRLDRFLGTLGTALSVAGRHDEAVPRLEDAMRLGGKPRVQAVRAYFLGLSVLARGDTTRAREMFERTVRDAPGTRWASRATERLASMVPYR